MIKLSLLLLSSSSPVASARNSRYVATSSFVSSFLRPSCRSLQAIFIRGAPALPIDSSATSRIMMSTQAHQDAPLVSISDSFDSGNGELVSAEVVMDDECDVCVKVRIREDP